MRSPATRRIATLVASLALIVPAATPTPASAGLLTGLLGGDGAVGSLLYVVDDLVDELLTGRTAMSAENCVTPTVSNPFAAYGDRADYFLVPGGDFSAPSDDWAYIHGGVVDGRAVLGASPAAAMSSKVCVGLNEPTMRFRYASTGSSPKLRVDAAFLGTNGELRTDYVTTISGARSSMTVSPIIRIGTNTRAAAGDKTAIRLVFTVQSGAWAIDDVYVDPFQRR